MTVLRSSKLNYFSVVASNELVHRTFRRKLDRSEGEELSGKVPVVVHNAWGTEASLTVVRSSKLKYFKLRA